MCLLLLCPGAEPQHLLTGGPPDSRISLRGHPLCGRAWNLLLSSPPIDSERQTPHTAAHWQARMLASPGIQMPDVHCWFWLLLAHPLSGLGSLGPPASSLQSPTMPSSSQVPPWTAPTPQNPCWCPHLQAVSLVLPLAFLYSFPSRMITGGFQCSYLCVCLPYHGVGLWDRGSWLIYPTTSSLSARPWHIVWMEQGLKKHELHTWALPSWSL